MHGQFSWVAFAFLFGHAAGRVTLGVHSDVSASLRAQHTRQPVDDMGDVSTEAGKHGSKMVRKINESPEEMPKDFFRDMEMLRHNFIPDFKPNLIVIGASAVVVSCACLWYALYFSVFYQHDRRLNTKEESAKIKEEAEEKQATMLGGHFDKDRFTADCRPDMVIVFHMPDCVKYEKENKTDVNAEKVSHIFRAETSTMEWEKFDQVIAEDETPEELNLQLVRSALLKDIHSQVRKMGFSAEAFTSIDKDEIFLCLSLSNEDYVKSFIATSHMDLQLQPEVVEHLGIGECTDDGALASPFIRYDPWAVAQLHKRGVLTEEDPRQMYMTYKARDPKGCLLSSLERFRVMLRQISSGFDLDTAKADGLIIGWYPAHSLTRLQQLALHWGDFRLISDFTFKQPINLINNYFGTRVSFLFAWNGLYCKALLALIPPALFWESAGHVAHYGFGVSSDEASRQVLGMTIMVLVWSKIAVNLWDREQDFFLKLWGLNPDNKDRIIRSEYRGKLQPSEHDANVKELQASNLDTNLRAIVSGICTSLFIATVLFAIMVWLSVFEGNMNLVAAICLTVKIKIFEFIWNILCGKLTEFENPKYADDYYNSFMLKQFLFSFVNNYWAFFFLAIKQKYTETGCPVGGCLWAVRKQLSITLTILSACRIFQVVLEMFFVKFAIWWEDRSLKKQLGTEDIPKRSFVEEQSKYADFEVAEQVQAMVQLVVPLGYVMMFGGIAPIIIPMCFLVFIISLRAGAYTLITSAKRPIPREMYGIGRWREVIQTLMYIGLFFSGFLLASYGDMLHGTWMITRMSIIGVFCLIVCTLWTIIDLLVPSSCRTAEIMGTRRNHIQRRLEEELAKANGDVIQKEANKATLTRSDKALQAGDWDNIKASADMVEEDMS